MRSIRRTLILSLAALVAVALATVGVLLDRLAGEALAARETSSRRFIEQHATQLAQEERARFDNTLSALVNRVANDLQTQYYAQNIKAVERYSLTMRMTPVGVLGAGLSPGGFLGMTSWYIMPFNRQANEAVAKALIGHLDLDEKPSFEDKSNYVMVTVEGVPERVYRSKSLENEKWAIPSFDSNTFIDEKFDTQKLSDGTAVRVATLKFSINMALRPPRGRTGIPRITPRPESPPESMTIPHASAFIQCGRPMQELDTKLTAIQETRDAELQDEAERTGRDRFGLRALLGLIGVIAFAILIIGGMILVRQGLKPLNTLSEAVGQVSQKDFRLPVEQEALSQELLPIHEKLTQTLAQLKQAFEHDKQAVADISHELRTPVAALLATLDVSLRKPREAEQYRQTLLECRAVTKQLQGLVERVMMLASLDASPSQALAVDVDAVELAQGVASVIRPLAETHGISVNVTAPQPVRVQTDADKLREVLLNLLHNAVEYNRPGGQVTLHVSNGGPKAVFAVADTGIGMTPDVQSRIFERFYRADPSRTATGIHAGLGLAIVKECVDRLGGQISVQSQPGQGSEFRVELPVQH